MKKVAYVLLTMLFLLSLSLFIYSTLSLTALSQTGVYISIIAILSVFGGYGLGEYWWDLLYTDKKNTPKWLSFFCKKK